MARCRHEQATQTFCLGFHNGDNEVCRQNSMRTSNDLTYPYCEPFVGRLIVEMSLSCVTLKAEYAMHRSLARNSTAVKVSRTDLPAIPDTSRP